MSPLGIKPILDDDTKTVVPPSTDEVSPKMKPTFVPMADIRPEVKPSVVQMADIRPEVKPTFVQMADIRPEVKPSVVQMAEGRPKIVKKADIRPNSGENLSDNK